MNISILLSYNILGDVMNIVPTKTNYCYQKLKNNIQSLTCNYPFVHSGIIGYSPLGKSIFYLRLGNGPKEVFYSASFHANEWITSLILMKFIEDYSNAYQGNSYLYGYSIRELFKTTSIYLVPMVNPDGVDLVTGNLEDTTSYRYAKSVAKRYPSICFPNGWKANIEGVDLKNYQPVCKFL